MAARAIMVSRSAGRPPSSAAVVSVFVQDLVFRNDGGSTASAQRMRGTVAFSQGQVPAGQLLEIRKSDGVTPFARQQIDAIADPYSDGSMSFAVVTIEQEDNVAAGASLTTKVYRGITSTASNTSAITNADLKALAITVDITAGGTTYTLNVSDQIDAGKIRDFAIGPVERQVQVWGLASNAGTPNQSIYVNVDLGLLRDGATYHAWAEIISNWDENYGTRNCAGTGTITAMRLRKSAADVLAYTGLSFNMAGGVGTDICNTDGTEFWSANAPTMRVISDPHQLSTASIIPFYPNHAGYISALGSPALQNFVPFATYDLEVNLDSTGPRMDIGWQPGWHAAAAVSQDGSAGAAWARKSRIEGLGASGIAKNWYGSSFGLSLVARNQTYGSIVGNNAISTIGSSAFTFSGGSNIFTGNNVFHWPFVPYWNYIVTGEPWWLRKSLVDANQAIVGTDASLRAVSWGNGDSQTTTIRSDGGARGYAWGLRNILCVRKVIPATHPLHDYIADAANDNLNWLDSANKSANMVSQAVALNVPTYFCDNPTPPGAGTSTRWFMICYLTMVAGMALKQGYWTLASKTITGVIDLNAIGMAVDGCKSRAQAYTTNFSIDNSLSTAASNIAQTWDHVAAGGDFAPTWDDTTKLIPSTGCPTSGSNSPYGISPSTYAGWWRSASATLADGGLTRAGTYYDYLQAQWGSVTDADLAAAPQWTVQRAA